jgi:hypothetical protein
MDWLIDFLTKYEWVNHTLVIIGSFRLICKPIFSVLNTYVDMTASVKDNEWLKKIEESSITKGLLYALDWIASIKVKR